MFATTTKFSEKAGLSYWTTRKLILTNRLPYIKVGNRYMIPIEEGLAALAKLASNGAEA